MGGEITWECNGNGEYVFTFKVYRDCSGINISPNASGLIQIHNYPTANQVTQIPPSQWTTVRDGDISPNCSGPGSFSCANGDPESVFEYVRTFTRRLNGVPPAAGWIITYDDNARNANDNLVGQPGITLRAKILPHSGSVADTCVDNSPQFQEIATSLICVGVPFNYNHNATDVELDSLVFEWARPLNAIGTNQLYVEGSVPSNISFQSGYSFNSPFPGVSQDPNNIPATLDPNTGEISLTSFTSGKFVSVVKVTAYKCGEAVSEIYRELQSNLANNSVCASNDKPVVRPPFQDALGNFTLFNDTVRAGDLVNFNLQIQDFASIAQNGGDSVTLIATGLQFGTNFTSTTGCFNPPCATLTSPLPQTGFLGVSNSFSWQTDCNHVSFTDQCVSGQNTYTFVISAIDNRCPLPLKNVGTISITVLADSVILSPLIHCVDVQPSGDVRLEWNLTPNIQNSFSAWMIYTATNPNGPYTLLDSVKTYSQDNYVHIGANAQNQRRWYYIRSRSGCKGIVQNVARDTVSTIFVNAATTPTQVDVNWNAVGIPNPSGSSAQYQFFREYPIGSGLGLFQNVNGTSLTDNFPNCEDSVRYRVDLANPLEGCTSRSNTLFYNVQFPEPNAGFGAPTAACPGATVTFTNGTTISGGTVSYVWDFGDGSPTSTQINPTHIYTLAGNYTVQLIATTPKGCADTISRTIQITLPTADAGPDLALCLGASTPIGGSPTSTSVGATFAWTPAASLNNATIANPTANPAVTTIYTVTVTDVNGCTNTDQMTVTITSPPTANAGPDRNTCASVPVMIGGAPTGPVGATYSWDNGATLNDPTVANPMASPTVTTTYTVTVSTGVGCSSTDQMTVTVDPSPTADAGIDQSICTGFGVSIGNPATGGTPGYTYSWSPATGLSATNITSPNANPTVTTTYTVTVTDANGCTDDDQVTVTVNSAVADAGGNFTICDGNSVTIGGSPNGTPPFSFSWNNGASLSANNVQNPVATPTVTTTYTLTVTDANGCTDTDQSTVTVNPNPTADAGLDQTICNGDNAVIGGSPTSTTPGATFAWNNGASLSSATAANPTATPSITTTYTVTVTHPNGCTNTDQLTITVNPTPIVDAGADQSICIGQSTAIGGSPTGPAGATYSWTPSATLNNASIANPTATPVVTTTYTVTVTDLNGCTDTDQITVTVNPLPTVDAGPDQTICNGQSATLGGTPTGPPLSTYVWDNPASLNNPNAANPIATPTTTTTYTVTVSDINGCSNTDQVTITVDPLPNADAGPDIAICNLQSTVIGGSPTSSTPGATFAWDNAVTLNNAAIANPTANPTVTTTYTVTVTHPNGCTNTDQMTLTINALPTVDAGADRDICIGQSTILGGSPTGPAGSTYSWDNPGTLDNPTLANPTATPTVTTTYSVTVTDANGCTNTDQVTITVNPLPTVDAGLDQTICDGENIVIGGSPTSTTPGSTFSWSPTASLNSGNFANPTASPTTTTTYTVTVTDPNGCTNTDQVTITVNPTPGADAGPDQSICNLQSVTIGGSPTSSTPGVSYSWNNGTSLNNSSIANPIATPNVTTTYTVTVTAGNGCTSTDQVTVTVNPLPTADAGLDRTICLGQSATLGGSPTGPTGATYAWTNGTSLNNPTAANPIATPTTTTTYTVTVTDGNGCTDTDQVTITVNPVPNVDAGPDFAICDLSSITIGGSPTSTTLGATFAWDNAASLNDASFANPTASPSTTTTYTVTVTHPNGCTATDQMTITVNPLPNADAGVDQDICLNQSAILGGSPTGPAGASYSWTPTASLNNPAIANPTATPTATTTYTVTVTDINGCTDTDDIVITVNPLPNVDAGADQAICAGQSATLGGSPTSSTPGATYSWDNPGTLNSSILANPIATPSVTTTYTVIVTDANGCSSTDQVVITVNPLPNVDAGPDQAICDGGSAVIGGSPTSSTSGVSYAWDNSTSLNNPVIANPTANPTVTTTYTVTITDANGCTDTDQMTLTVNPLPIADAGTDQTICDGDNATLGGSPTGPAGSSYSWDNPGTLNDATASNPIANPTVTTTYNVTVTDANGCVSTDDVIITVNPNPVVEAGPDQTICRTDSVMIGGSPTGPAGVTYSWTPTNGLSDPTVANPMASPSDTTKYFVTITNANSCISIDSMVVNVNELPIVDFRVEPVCLGDFAAFTDLTTLNNSTIQSWNWDFGDNSGTSVLQNPAYQYVSAGNYQVKLIVTSALGCVDSIRKTVTVSPLPLADAGLDIEICAEDSVMIGGSPTGPLGATYSWSPALGLSDAGTANPMAYPLTTTEYRLSVTDQNGCINYDTMEVIVNPLPTVISNNDTSICKGDNVQLQASGAVAYAWQPTTGLSNSQIANPIASPEKSTTYVVFGTDANGCIDTDTTFIRVFTIEFIPNDTSVCIGDSVRLVPTIDADLSATIRYIWSPTIGLDNPNSPTPMASPPVTIDYKLLVEDQKGCIDSDFIRVNIDPGANVNFEYEVLPRCQGAIIELTNTSTSSDEFQWKLNGNFASNEFNPSLQLDFTVENTVTLIGTNSTCTDSITKVIPAMSFDEIFQFKDANVFTPNSDGVNDIFNPGFKGEFVGCVDFRIYDRWGNKMFDSNSGQYGWDGRTMYGDRAPTGMYFYIIQIAEKEIRGSIYLQR
jgi:gliding motility-associated-like protein